MRKNMLLSLFLASLMLSAQAVFAETESEEYEKFERISSYAANLYIDENVTTETIMEEALRIVMKDKPELMNELIKAGFQSLDEYTEFYTKEEYELFEKNLNHIVYGIGVIIQQLDDYVTIMSCTEGGGAAAAGVQSGDKIAKVDGVDVKGQSVDKVQDLVVGELGTEVTITFLRGGQEFERTITRQEVKGTTVAGEILEGNIGYIAIVNFASETANEFVKVLEEFDASGVTDIILDLRDNPGGYLGAAVDIASVTVPEGVIVDTVYRDERNNSTAYSYLKEPKYKFAVLINENTASAAEVLASAIGDSGIGILVGDRSYGKGVIQQMFEIWDGCAFKVTTGRYFTRNGYDINGNGIEPNEYVDNTTKRIDITKYSTFDYQTKPSVGETSPNVLAAKERLKILGYYTGSVNDNFDEAFREAVTAFQATNGLFPYGVLDVSTQATMENVFYKLEELVDNQLFYAYEYFGGNRADLME